MEARWLLRGCTLVLGVLVAASLAIASPVPASAASGHVAHAEEAIDKALAGEHKALDDSELVGSDLRPATEDLESAIRAVEAGFAGGEIEVSEAAQLVLDLRDALREDRDAIREWNGQTAREGVDRHIQAAMAHKHRARNLLSGIAVSLTGAAVSHADTPPPLPEPVINGSVLDGMAEPDLGDIAADSEALNRIEKELVGKLARAGAASRAAVLFDPFVALARASAVGPTSNVTVSGEITSYTVKGYTVSSNRPGPGGSGEIRLGVEEPQPNGQVKVLSTSNPPNLLPHTPGTYTFAIGPPATGFAMPVTKGDVVSLDTPGGNYAVFASRPGAQLETSQGTGLEQNPGVLWTLAQHANLELLLQVTIEPSISVGALEEAEKRLKEALRLEHNAAHGSEKHVVRALKKAGQPLHKATELVAAAAKEGAISAQTEASIDFYLNNAATDVRDARVTKNGLTAKGFAYASAVETQEALTRVTTAKGLAKQTP
jgi:hypothetical protein